MQVWMIFELAFALAAASSCIALIIGDLHMAERATWQELFTQASERIANMGSRV